MMNRQITGLRSPSLSPANTEERKQTDVVTVMKLHEKIDATLFVRLII